MDLAYVKENFLLIQNYNDEIKLFKSRIIDATYLYEKIKNYNNFLNDIKKIQKDMDDYIKSILLENNEIINRNNEKKKKIYYLFPKFIGFILSLLFLYNKNIIIQNNISIIILIILYIFLVFGLFIFISLKNPINIELIKQNIDLLAKVCNNLIYSNEKSLIN